MIIGNVTTGSQYVWCCSACLFMNDETLSRPKLLDVFQNENAHFHLCICHDECQWTGMFRDVQGRKKQYFVKSQNTFAQHKMHCYKFGMIFVMHSIGINTVSLYYIPLQSLDRETVPALRVLLSRTVNARSRSCIQPARSLLCLYSTSISYACKGC